MDFDDDSPALPPKIRPYADRAALLAKLDGRAALWHRTAEENRERADAFEQAAQAIRNGATTVTVGRTTYTLSAEPE